MQKDWKSQKAKRSGAVEKIKRESEEGDECAKPFVKGHVCGHLGTRDFGAYVVASSERTPVQDPFVFFWWYVEGLVAMREGYF